MRSPNRILIVDDDARFGRAVADALEQAGYRTTLVLSAQEALDSLEKSAPDVALLEPALSEPVGPDLLRATRVGSPSTQCIVVTAHPSQSSAIEALNLGVSSYLEKPCGLDQILKTVRRAVQDKEDRQALRMREERFRRFFRMSPDCAFITSRDGRWLEMNEAAIELFGYEDEKALRGVNTRKLFVTPSEGATLASTIESLGGVKDYPVELRARSGDTIHALVTALALRDQRGKTTGFQGTIGDVTGWRQAEEALTRYAVELAQKNAALQQLNQKKNEFLGIAAHELRNPLHFVLSYSEFLLEEAANSLTEEHLSFLSIIQSSSEFMVRLVNDLLDISRIEADSLHLNWEPTDLVALVRRNVSLNRTLAAKRDVHVQLRDEPIPVMVLDPGKTEQVLHNLLNNAVKYSPAGATVDVELAKGDGRVVVAVHDQGPGIPEDDLGKVFLPFETTSIESLTGEKGTGLGLVIAKRIAQGHGGDLWVESEPGRGTTFYLALPISEDEMDRR